MPRKSRKPQLPTEEITAVVPMQPKFSTAVYTRLSLEDNNLDDGYSIEAQKEMLFNFVEEQEDMALYAVYCDNGFTGSNFDRDDFNRMMDDIRNGKVNAIVVKDLSRFGRNYIETGNYIEKILPFMGVRFVSVNDGYDSERSSNADIMVALRNIVNHAYVTDISRKIKTMFETKQNNGDFIGWSAPYGYLKSEENNNRLVIDPETAPIAKQIYEWKVEGLGFMAIARKLNEMEIPSPRMRNIANGRYKIPPKDGRLWTDASVAWIIKSPTYAGHIAQRKFTRNSVNGKQVQLKNDEWVVVRNTHDPIVSDELWEAAQNATKKNIERYGINFRKPSKNKGDNIFKGLLLCPNCNKVMQHRVDSKWGHLRYYICNMRRANPNCDTEMIRESVLVDVLFGVIKKEIATAADVCKLLVKASKSKSHLERLSGLQKAIRNTETRIKRISALKTNLFDTFGDELITEQEFKDMKDEYTTEADNLQSELTEYQQEYEQLSSAYSKDNKRITSFLKFKSQKVLTREMLTELIERIIIHGTDSIEIIWRYEDEYRAICGLVGFADEVICGSVDLADKAHLAKAGGQ